jgi:hypothetical protein
MATSPFYLKGMGMFKSVVFTVNPRMYERMASTRQMLVAWGLDETLAHVRIHCKLQHF